MDLFVGDGDGDDGAGEIVAAAAVAAAVNPLGSSNPSNVEDAEQMEAEAEADERTVVSEVPREVGWFRVLSRPDGRPSLLCRYIQAVPVLMVMVQLFDYTPKGDAQFVGRAWEDFSEGAQSLISLAMFGLCFALVSPIMLVTSIQGALKPGGELEQLGAGSAAISVSSERRLRILRRFIMLPAALVVSMGTASHAMACVVAYRKYFLGEELQQCLVLQDGTERCFKDPLGPAYMLGMGGCVLGLGTCVLLGFWPSMILASSLCRDQISKLMVVLRKADPSDKASWDRDVVGPAFAIDHAMRTLSRGWGSALLGLGLASWCMAFNFFCKAINNEYVDAKDQTRPGGGARANYLVFFVFYAMLPLLVSLEVAQTSTRCDTLMSTLNAVRIRSGEECNDRITWLETSLMRMHHGQGMGFTILGNVVDRRVLRNLGIAMFGSISTGITALFALTEEAPPLPLPPLPPCLAINAAQTAAIASFRLAGNETCQYNVTVNGVMVP